MSERRRFPRHVYREGSEPDARFTLANERTFLAWIRTALAFLAGGVALELLGLNLQRGCALGASLLLVSAGIVIPPLAWWGWARTERALRNERPLPSSPLGLVLAIVAILAGTLIVLGILLK